MKQIFCTRTFTSTVHLTKPQRVFCGFLLIVFSTWRGLSAGAAQLPPPSTTQAVSKPPETSTVHDAPQNVAPEVKSETSRRVAAEAFEKRYGIHIIMIAVTAGGGMVDLRFKVVDQEKARSMFNDAHRLPVLVADDSGLRLNAPHHMAGNVRVQNGALSFLLYPNVRNAVKAGTPVSVVFGDVRLEAIKAQ